MNRLPLLSEMPQDAQDAIAEFVRTGNIPKLDKDLDICIKREYSVRNRIKQWFNRKAAKAR